MKQPANIVWFRRDLRLSDNPALEAAAEGGGPVIALFVDDPGEANPWRPSARSRAREGEALGRLRMALLARGSELVVRKGRAADVLGELSGEISIRGVHWNRRHEPFELELEAETRRRLDELQIEWQAHEGGLLFDPERFLNSAGAPYRVFTPFWRACQARAGSIGTPRTTEVEFAAADAIPRSDAIEFPRKARVGSEIGATMEFLDRYAEERDRPGLDATSRLSSALHFGEVGPRQLWAAAEAKGADGSESFARQIAWREFAHHLLHHYPETPERPMRRQFENLPWREDHEAFELWKLGRTGYPIVDAGMRQLAEEGWMHNRVRMIAASFLVKHLLIDWREGARFFWQSLADADLANNTMGWQWIAGCGVDAAPYFRIFNPTLQAQRFDPQGDYVRRWLPELRNMPTRWIHRPWAAPDSLFAPSAYPEPIVDLGAGRKRALSAFAEIAS